MFHFNVVWNESAFLLGGAFFTLQVMASAFLLAFIIGLLVASVRLSKHKALRIPAGFYVEICRNTPALVQLIWIFYCLPIFLGIDINPTLASIIALAFNSGAYMAEDFRAGILSVEKGQIEAARTLGLSHRQTMLKIVVPQAIRVLIPPLVNHAASLMKWSSLVSVLGVADLTYRAQLLSSQTFRPIEIFTFVGGVYLAMSMVLSITVRAFERRWRSKY